MKDVGGALGTGRGEPCKRKRERILVLLAARLVTTFRERPVRIREVSSEGAMIECETASIEGTEVVLRRGAIEVKANVVWSNGRQCGLEFVTAMEEEDFLTFLNPPVPNGLAPGSMTTAWPSPRDEAATRADHPNGRYWIVPPRGRG